MNIIIEFRTLISTKCPTYSTQNSSLFKIFPLTWSNFPAKFALDQTHFRRIPRKYLEPLNDSVSLKDPKSEPAYLHQETS